MAGPAMAAAAPGAAPKKSVFERQRERINQQSVVAEQEGQDALKRNFARMNNLNSGAYVAQTQKVSDDVAKRREQALLDVDAQEQGVEEQRAEAEKGRTFAREERLGSQDFASGEANKGRLFAREERLGGQEFVAGQSAIGRAFAQQEREAGQNFQSAMVSKQQDFAAGEAQKQREYGTSEREASQTFASEESAAARAQQQTQFDATLKQSGEQFDKQFVLDETVSNFNMDMAKKIFEKKDFFEKAIDPFGGIDRSAEKAPGVMGAGGKAIAGGAVGGMFGGIAGAFA
jgi:hypothetical protein